MSHIFISHSETDERVARDLGTELEKAGLKVWFHERDSLPGPTYLTQVAAALRESQAVIVIVSPASLKSHEVTNEIARAHQLHKPFVPVLHGITHAGFLELRDDWSQCFGASTSISIPAEGASAVVPRIVQGLALLGIKPGAAPTPPEPKPTPEPAKKTTIEPTPVKPRHKPEPAKPRRKFSPWLWVGIGGAVVAALVLAYIFWPKPSPSRGRLEVSVKSWGQEEPIVANVKLDGGGHHQEFIVEGRGDPELVPAGHYTATVFADGFFPWTGELEVGPGQALHKEYQLLPDDYTVGMNRDDFPRPGPTDLGAERLAEVADILRNFPMLKCRGVVFTRGPRPEDPLAGRLASEIREYLVERPGIEPNRLEVNVGPRRSEGVEHEILFSFYHQD